MKPNRPKSRFSLWQRVVIFSTAYAGYFLIYLLGSTLRWQVRGWENWASIGNAGKRRIYSSWHECLLPAAYFWRRRGITVLVSQHFDGEYIARSIQMLGNGVARGSSTTGAVDGLHQMTHALRNGADVAFLVDGPKGPRHVAKIGPILVAKRTGNAILCFHIAFKKNIQLKSWDRLQIPLPFTKTLLFIAQPIYVPKNADKHLLEQKHAELQRTLDQLREEGDNW